MAQSNSGIGNVIPNTQLAQMAMSYARRRMLGAAARLAWLMHSQTRCEAPMTWPKLVRGMSMLRIACCVGWPASVLWRKHTAVFSATGPYLPIVSDGQACLTGASSSHARAIGASTRAVPITDPHVKAT